MPSGCDGGPTGLDHIVVGPEGMVDMLEQRLGIAPPKCDQATRLLDYRAALLVVQSAAGGDETFYSQSFDVDPLGSAKVLLSWRDALKLAGWHDSGSSSGGKENAAAAPKRLGDLARVEAAYAQAAPASYQSDLCSRLERLIAALQAGLCHGVDKVALVGDRAEFPKRWREVLALLPVEENAYPLPTEPLAPTGSQLHALQSGLLGNKADDEVTAADETAEAATVRVVQAAFASRSADAAATLLQRLLSESGPDSIGLISRGDTNGPLNQSMQQLALPQIASGNRTVSGTLMQLPALVLALHWQPADPQAWLTFLLHPAKPVAARLAKQLAYTIQSTPARDSEAWDLAIAKVLNETDLGDETETANEIKRLKKQVKQWLSPERFEKVADPKVLSDTIGQLRKWAVGRAKLVEDDAALEAEWKQAAKQYARLEKLLLSSPEKLNKDDLAQVMAEWLSGGAAYSTDSRAEVGGPANYSQAAHLLVPIDHVLWWQPQDAGLPVQPWNQNELAWLEGQDMVFADEAALRRAANDAAIRPILLARCSISLYPGAADTSVEISQSTTLVRLEAELGDRAVYEAETMIQTSAEALVPLPRAKREWQISDASKLAARDQESFSSLNKFIYSPWEWVLSYSAKLRAGAQYDYRIIDDARSRGSLLHGFVESLLEPEMDPLAESDKWDEKPLPARSGSVTEETTPSSGLLETLIRRLFEDSAAISWDTIEKSQIDSWIEEQWSALLASHAAQYLCDGHEAACSELLYLAKTGLWELLQHLREADVQEVTCEERIKDIDFCGGKLGGFIDLRCVNGAGKVAVVDLKLGGLSYRKEELEKGRHLQLATYGHLVKQQHGADAHCAYFIFIGGGSLIARNRDYFESAEVPRSMIGDDEWQTCWQEFEALWQWRRAQLDAGRIEVSLGKFKPQIAPHGHWSVEEPDRYSDYLTLAGVVKG